MSDSIFSMFDVDRVKEVTRKWSVKYWPPEQGGKPELSEKAKKIASILNKEEFNDYEELEILIPHLANMFSILLGEDITDSVGGEKTETVDFVSGQSVTEWCDRFGIR